MNKIQMHMYIKQQPKKKPISQWRKPRRKPQRWHRVPNILHVLTVYWQSKREGLVAEEEKSEFPD